ncbi:MAG TPA: EAL domain-containing protein, partial [Pseudomonadales bacterium]|nr:EAL domain-containing protein [Pseudomonadales bacterium]
VFHEAIQSIVDWRTRYGEVISLSVNKSPVQFHSQERFKWLDALKQSDLPPKSITVEITEGLLIRDIENIKIQLKNLHDNLVEVSIDDFGTGYSALSYLKNFEIDYLKIDKGFINNITQDEHDKALTEAIIVMAHKLGMRTIAEGVEEKEQLEILKSFGCDYVQGFYFSPPIPKEEFDRLLTKQFVTPSEDPVN